MAEQAIGLNIHGDHFYGLEDVIGAIKNAYVEDDCLIIDFLITKKHSPIVQDLLDTGVQLGLSIGGYVTSYDEKNDIIKEIELREISLTAMPANLDTFGTVTSKSGVIESNCLTGACYNIIKNIGAENMTQKETKPEEETPITLEDVKNFLDEYMAEKEATMVEEVTNTVQTNLEALVESKVNELLDKPEEEPESSEEEPSEEEAKAEPEEEKPEDETENEEDDDTSKSLDIADAISKGISDALGEDFVDAVAAKMFSNMDQVRTSKGSKLDAYVKSQTEPEPEVTTTKSTYSTKETAKLLLQKQEAANPVMAAAMKNLK